MKNTLSTALIDQFLIALEGFGDSSQTATVQYNTGKLIDILREKEVFDVCQVTREKYDAVNEIDIKLGKVVKDIVFETHLDESYKEYLTFEAQIERETAGDLYIYAKQGALSVKSLYFYKAQNWDKAIDFTVECVALNDYLVHRGMSSLNLRIFEQNKNISRILYKSGRNEEGAILLNHLFNYLLNGVNNGLYGSIFHHPEYWEKVPIIRETYAYELVCMIVEDMIWFYPDSRKLYPMDWYEGLDFEVDNPNRQVIYNFMYINRQMHSGNYDDLVDSLIYYFEQPISIYYEIFKVSLLVDFIKLVRSSDHPDIERVEARVQRFLFDHVKMTDRMKKYLSEKSLVC